VRLGTGRALDISPDSKWVISIDVRKPDRLTLWPVGAGTAKSVSGKGLIYQWARFLPDGQRLVVSGARGTEPAQLWIQQIESGELRAVAQGCCSEPAAVAPGGERIAGMNPAGRPSVVSLVSGVVEPLTVRGLPVRWASDEELYLLQRAAPARILKVNTTQQKKYELWADFRPSEEPALSQLLDAKLVESSGFYVYSFMRRLSDLYVVEGWK